MCPEEEENFTTPTIYYMQVVEAKENDAAIVHGVPIACSFHET
jgi:hypothetical protein